jgi:cytochrome c biogenesis protein CcmG/thiol:disulfide interchange protein DsbE
VGQPAPEFTLKDMQGKPVALSSFRGKAVVLNFWATWCPPCKEETPWLVDAQKRYAAQGLQIVGVSMDDSGDQKQVAKFMEETAINYPILLGKEDVAQKYGGIEGLPTTFYIDRNGVVSEQVLGQRERSEIEQSIQKLLAVR